MDSLIEQEIWCPLTKLIMAQATSTVDGYYYEEDYIKKWLEKNDTNPITGQKLNSKQLIPNYFLRKFILNKLQNEQHFIDNNMVYLPDKYKSEMINVLMNKNISAIRENLTKDIRLLWIDLNQEKCSFEFIVKAGYENVMKILVQFLKEKINKLKSNNKYNHNSYDQNNLSEIYNDQKSQQQLNYTEIIQNYKTKEQKYDLDIIQLNNQINNLKNSMEQLDNQLKSQTQLLYKEQQQFQEQQKQIESLSQASENFLNTLLTNEIQSSSKLQQFELQSLNWEQKFNEEKAKSQQQYEEYQENCLKMSEKNQIQMQSTQKQINEYKKKIKDLQQNLKKKESTEKQLKKDLKKSKENAQQLQLNFDQLQSKYDVQYQLSQQLIKKIKTENKQIDLYKINEDQQAPADNIKAKQENQDDDRNLTMVDIIKSLQKISPHDVFKDNQLQQQFNQDQEIQKLSLCQIKDIENKYQIVLEDEGTLWKLYPNLSIQNIQEILKDFCQRKLNKLEINQYGNNIKDTGLKIICNELSKVQNFQHLYLDLQENLLKLESIRFLCQTCAQFSSLKCFQINLSQNEVGQNGAILVSQTIQQLQNLIDLSLFFENNKIQDKGVEFICLSISRLQNISSLSLCLRLLTYF